ncbi:hypothetical protein T01_13180 [Trichinella spiralis]|uniref:Uncharacterized protein n=1 Tax=Trichinella spiralis TaxID=6334 RepID=A0A0V0YZW7_TRISP|nr:hypothetical protein T01_13180 [Trichinella spiralis]
MTAFIQSRELRKKRWIASTSILVLELRQLTRNANCTDQFLITSINSLSS